MLTCKLAKHSLHFKHEWLAGLGYKLIKQPVGFSPAALLSVLLQDPAFRFVLVFRRFGTCPVVPRGRGQFVRGALWGLHSSSRHADAGFRFITIVGVEPNSIVPGSFVRHLWRAESNNKLVDSPVQLP